MRTAMLLPRVFAPVRASSQAFPISVIPASRVFDAIRAANGSASSPILSFVRHATHQSQGRANGAKDGPGKRLGAKKSGGEYVIPGNIIFRQRGTAWFAGENCGMGRDHCIFAKQAGYVRYYRDPLRHPKRQYIGVALEKNDTLPYPPNAARRRRLNMLPTTRETELDTGYGQIMAGDLQVGDGAGSDTTIGATTLHGRHLLRGKKGYAAREANWSIGRAAEKANVQVKKFVPGDRFTAWQRSRARKEANAERRRLRTAQKATKSKKK